jgi:probable phosphomutase (TIGR03848 family)
MATTENPPARRTRPKGPAPTLILFVRHGTTPTTGQVLPGRAPGLHLADAGRAQAERVAERLAAWSGTGPATAGSLRPTAIYASPLERTRETAAPIAGALGLKVKVNRGLLECDFGDWTGGELKALGKLPEWSTVQRYPSGFRFPHGESFTGMQARIVEATAAICAQHRGEAVIAVSHADPIKAVVAAALGTHLDLFQRIVVSPCSVTAISYGSTGPTVLAVNSTGTLAELKPS